MPNQIATIALVIFGSGLGTLSYAQEAQEADTRPAIPTARVAVTYPAGVFVAGKGWRSAAEEVLLNESCVSAASSDNYYDRSESLFYRVSKKSELEESLSISASASGSYYGVSGSASYNFSRNVKVSDESLNIAGNQFQIVFAKTLAAKEQGDVGTVISSQLRDASDGGYADAILGADEISTIRLKPAAEHLLRGKNENLSKFYEVCGDSYIESVMYGGQLVAMFSLQTRSREEREKTSASLGIKGGGGPVGGAVSVSSNKEVRTLNADGRLSILVSRTGGATQPTPIDLTTFEQTLIDYPAAVANTPASKATPILVTLKRYDTLTNWPEKLNIPAEWSTAILLKQGQNALIQLRDDIQAVSKNEFNSWWFDLQITPDSLKQLDDAVQQTLNQFTSRLDSCSTDFTKCDLSGLSTDDYGFRLGMPAKTSDIESLPELVKQQKAVASQLQHLTLIPLADANALSCSKIPTAGLHVHKFGGKVYGDRVSCLSLVKSIPDGRERIAKLEQKVALESVEQAVDRWLVSENQSRCRSSAKSWGCVLPRNIEALRSKRVNGLTPTSAETIEDVVASTRRPGALFSAILRPLSLDRAIDVTPLTNLKFLADCWQHHVTYDMPKVGLIYYDADISCAGSMAYIEYSRKSNGGT